MQPLKVSQLMVIVERNAAAFISLKGSKLIQNFSEKNFVVVTAKAREVTKSKNCKRLKLQTGGKESSSNAPSSPQVY